MTTTYVAILAAIAIILSLLSFWVARNKASKRALDEIIFKNSELNKQIHDINKQLASIKDMLSRESPHVLSQTQAASSFNESSILKESLENIQKNLQSISLDILLHSEEIQSMKKNQFQTQDAGLITQEIIPQEPNLTVEMSTFTLGDNSLHPLDTFEGIKFENPEEAADHLLPSRLPEPFEQIAKQYQDAINRGDRQAIRQMQFKELNITSESENSLIKGNSGDGTKLEAVVGGGSYLIIVGEGRYWLFPTAQTLESFSINQPQKGIFSYERELLHKPVIKKPAEVLEEGDYWIIKKFGLVSVPG